MNNSFQSFFDLLETAGTRLDITNRFYCKFTSREQSPNSKETTNVFDKLHYQSVQLKSRHLRRQFESKKRKEQEQRKSCTFRPNTHRTVVIDEPQQFYQRNIQWLQRKNKAMLKLQCQKAESKLKQQLSNTARKAYKGKQNKQNKEKKTPKTLGVNQFLQRYKKARQERKYKQQIISIPNAHCWNLKKQFLN